MTKLAIGGWQANLLAFYQSGVPFTVLDGVSPVPSNVSNLVTTDRPNVIAGAPYAPAHQNYNNWININAFTPQTVGTVGNESRDQLYGPNQRSADFSLFKDFEIRERMKLQFRAEVYNITNTENFGQPNITITKWNATIPGFRSVRPARRRFSRGRLRPDHCVERCPNPRQYQFALKFIFKRDGGIGARSTPPPIHSEWWDVLWPKSPLTAACGGDLLPHLGVIALLPDRQSLS